MNLRIDIRDQRLPEGRLTLSARTRSKVEWRRREAAVRFLLERGEFEILELLRKRKLHIAQVEQAYGTFAKDPDALAKLKPSKLPDILLGAVRDQFVDTITATRAGGTLSIYRTYADRIVECFGADTPMPPIGPSDVEGWLHTQESRRDGARWSTATQHTVRSVGRRLWSYAIKREREAARKAGVAPRLTDNPWSGIEMPELWQTRVAFLKPPEWRRLHQTVEDTPKAALFALGALAGLRQQEVAHLRTDLDLDLGRREVKVQPREGLYAWRPKRRRSVRVVPMGEELHVILSRHVELGYAGERYFIRRPGQDRPVGSSAIINWTRDGFTAAGVKYGQRGDALTFHSLRHTFASWLAQRDVSPLKIAYLLGDTVNMVIKVYGHLIPQDYERAAAVIDGVVRDA